MNDPQVRILIVDDEKNMLNTYRRIFLETPFQVRYADSGQAAVKEAVRFVPDIILLDVMMPGMNGYDACTRLKSVEALKDTEMIFVTAKQDLPDKLNGYRRGGSDYLCKPFDPEELLAKLSVIATRKRRYSEQASIDGLTGVGNRKVFDKQLGAYFQLAERYHRRLSLAIIDADHFKRINDAYGHPAGDAVLKTLAVRIARNIRQSDILARIGGEEFAVLMPETGKPLAADIMDRIRRSVASTPIPLPACGSCVSVTISIGIAEFPTDNSSPEALYGQADRALYRAKQNGRNRIEAADAAFHGAER